MPKYINIDEIGNVELNISNRARKLKLGIRPSGTPYVVYPNHPDISINYIISFVEKHKQWIINQKNITSEKQYIYQNGSSIKLYDDSFINIITNANCNEPISSYIKDNVQIVFPINTTFNTAKVQQYIKGIIDIVLREKASTGFPPLVKRYAQKFNLSYNRVSIKNTKTRWGSCSSTKNINLNLQLARIPNKFVHYVILHELAHTVEMNHSPRFWQLLEKIHPNAKQTDKALKAFHPEIY